METATRSTQTCTILAVLAGALAVTAFTALKLDAVPALPAQILLALSLAVMYGAMLGAIGRPSRPGPAAGRPGPGAVSAVAEDDVRHPSEAERVRAWRRARLAELGVPDDIAFVLAEDASFSVHELERLLAEGCPLGTAVRILWPA